MYSDETTPAEIENHEDDGHVCYACFRAMVTTFFDTGGLHPYAAIGMMERLKLEILDEQMSVEEPEEDDSDKH